MTRLRTEDITNISVELKQNDKELVGKTGLTLSGIACHALALEEKESQSIKNNIPFAVIPILSGKGLIPGFSSTIRDIMLHIGLNAFVTKETDVAGIAEAVEKGAEVIMLADDEKFVAIHLETRHIVDNSNATAKGFVTGLDLMTGGIDQQKVLVIGCGPLGRSAVTAALQRGANVSVFDIDIYRSNNLAEDIYKLNGKIIAVESSINSRSISDNSFDLIIEATNSADVLQETDITSRTYIAAPGMPLGLTPAAVRKTSDRLLHDPLQLGVSVMAFEAAQKLQS